MTISQHLPQHLTGYACVVEQAVDWADMDPFQHVNNVVYFRYFENGRIEWFRQIGWWDSLPLTGIGPIVASTAARFRRPVKYPDRLLCGTKVTKIGTDRFTLAHRLVSQTTGEITTEGDVEIVAFDYRNGGKVAIPEAIRIKLVA
jgi:acyl-CoA thioester hydrolase